VPENRHKQKLLDRLRGREARVAVVGLGHVGLPLAVMIAASGLPVTGVDVSEDRVKRIMGGGAQLDDVDPAQLNQVVSGGLLTATMDSVSLRDVDVAVITVPTPVDEHRVPDITAIRDASAELAANMRKGTLVVLESTTYPGTTEEVVVAAFRAQGFRPGADVFIGYSPERIDPGNEHWNIGNTPKIVAGLTAACLEIVIAFYGSFVVNLVPVSDLRTAEMSKLFENIFRVVNIALANELQIICEGFGIDVWEVLAACSTKPFGFMTFQPGPGLGGHCVPVDPFYLAYKAREKNINTEFIELAGRINAAMPAQVVTKVVRLLNGHRKSLNSARIGLLGISYKRNTADVRESPAIRLVELLEAAGAVVTYHDPHVPRVSIRDREYESQPLISEFLATQDAVIVVTDHDSIDWSLVLQYTPFVVDTRNVLGRLRPGARNLLPADEMLPGGSLGT
jgi:UDP-N-acetyl-D-glucosamine dehydrogenase